MPRMALAMAIVLAAAAATSSFTTRDAHVQLWLDRAEQEVRLLVARPMPDAVEHVTNKLDLALVLVQTRPSEANKKLLRDVMAQPMAPPKPPETPEIRAMSWHYIRSVAHAAMGETAAARAEAGAFDESLKALPDPHIMRMFAGIQLASAWAKVGDVDRAVAGAMRFPIGDDMIQARMTAAREFRAAANPAGRATIIADAVAEAKKIGDPAKQADALRTIVRELAEGGDLDAALALARQMPAKDPRVDAFSKLARNFSTRAGRGDADRAGECVNAALETLEADKGRYAGSIVPVGELAVELGYADAAKRAVAMVEKTPGMSADPYTNARAARTAAAAGDKAAYARLVTATERAIKQLGDAQSKSSATLLLASAFARAGEKQRANDAIGRAKQLYQEKDYSYADGALDILEAFADVGDMKYAEELAARAFALKPADIESLYADSLVRHLRAGRFDAARADALRQTRPMARVDALLRVALRQARDGQADAVTAWVQTLPAGYDRAVLYLALAHQATGIDPRYWLRTEHK